MDSFTFLLILRIALVALLYLVILQVVVVARRDLRRASVAPVGVATRAKQVVGHLIVVDSGSTPLVPGSQLDIEPITTIGRSPTNSIVLNSNYVSTEHARIIYKDRSLWAEDIGSRNGTLLDQRPLTQPIAVSPGSILQVGDVRFKFAV
ncbi:MAG: FHA domain-containing protein [Ktedonobacterales bacterium]